MLQILATKDILILRNVEKLLKEKISTLKKDTNKMPHINKVIDFFLFFKKKFK
mgnify:CR=1 FL=1